MNLPRGPFVAAPHPLFRDPHTLLREHLGYYFAPGSGNDMGIRIFISTARAKINLISVGRDRLTLGVALLEPEALMPLGKAHVVDEAGRACHVEFETHIEPVTIKIDPYPRDIFVGLIGPAEGELIDYRSFGLSPTGLSEGSEDVRLDLPTEEELEALLVRGENDQVEFKSTLKEAEDIAETLVAFGNSRGGLIVVGVDKHGEPVGVATSGAENTVQNIVRAYCDPVVEAEVESTMLRGKPVLLIRVREGADKPFTLRGRGVIVRAGSTDRAATRWEIDGIYERKRKPPAILG